jgi:flagellar hook-basal body complex protein FliE
VSIPAIGAISPTLPTLSAGSSTAVTGTSGTGGTGFASALTGAVDNLQQLQSTSDTLNIQAATGNLNDIQDATVAAAQVETTVQLVSALRNEAVQGFNQIMNMGS